MTILYSIITHFTFIHLLLHKLANDEFSGLRGVAKRSPANPLE